MFEIYYFCFFIKSMKLVKVFSKNVLFLVFVSFISIVFATGCAKSKVNSGDKIQSQKREARFYKNNNNKYSKSSKKNDGFVKANNNYKYTKKNKVNKKRKFPKKHVTTNVSSNINNSDNYADIRKRMNEKNNICKNNNYKHFGLIISGPSGVGKTSLINGLAKRQNNIYVAISATTREKRNNEIDGKDYYFLTKSDFNKLIKQNKLIEYDKKFKNYYGSPSKNYFNAIKNGKDPVFALSVNGMENAKKHKDMDFVTVFISPAQKDVLIKRLNDRGTETAEQLALRVKEADKEINQAYKYDYVLYVGDNDDINDSIKMLEAIYLAEQKKREKCYK